MLPDIPPIIPYVFGAVLVVFGLLRAVYLGAPRPPRPTEDEPESATLASPVRGPAQRRHLRWGVIDVALGLFLIISVYVQTHRR
jgi:hypothetical protein